MQQAIIYARVSTDEQAKSGNGLEYQIEQCQERARQNGYTLVHAPITDDYSGRSAIRPGTNKLLEMIEPLRIDVVLIHRTDRLGRKAAVQDMLEAEIESRGARVEYIAHDYDRSTPQGRAMRRIAGVFDELDCDNIVEKLVQHKYQAVRRGSVIAGRPPYGYDKQRTRGEDGKPKTILVINEQQAAVVRKLFEYCVYGCGDGKPMTLYALAQWLNTSGVPLRDDSRSLRAGYGWSASTVSRILENETYMGRWHYCKRKSAPNATPGKDVRIVAPRSEWLGVDVPTIIDAEVWHAAQEQKQKNKLHSQRNQQRLYIFSGLITCRRCKSAFCGMPGYKGELRYYCRRQQRHPDLCGMATRFNERELDRAVWQWICEIVKNPDLVRHALQERQQVSEEQNTRIRGMIAAVDALITSAHEEQARVMTLYKKGKLDDDRWELEDAECQAQIDRYEQQRAELVAQLVEQKYTPDYINDVETACARIAHGMDHFTKAEKRETYQMLEVSAELTVEDDMKIAHVECIIDVQRLVVNQCIENRRSRRERD